MCEEGWLKLTPRSIESVLDRPRRHADTHMSTLNMLISRWIQEEIRPIRSLAHTRLQPKKKRASTEQHNKTTGREGRKLKHATKMIQ